LASEIVYQGFSLLTANRRILARPELALIAKRMGRTIPQIIFRFAIDIGMLPLINVFQVVVVAMAYRTEKLRFGQRIHAMVTKHVVPIGCDRRVLTIDR